MKLTKRVILIFALSMFLIFQLNITFSYVLSDYPMMFVKDGVAKIRFILGRNALIYDGIAAAVVISSLQNYFDSKDIPFIYSFTFDDSIDSVFDLPSMVIGGPCANSAASELFDYPINCREPLIPGHGLIKLFENNNPVIFLGGYFWQDTLNAAYVLSNWKKYNLNGMSLDVTTEQRNKMFIS